MPVTASRVPTDPPINLRDKRSRVLGVLLLDGMTCHGIHNKLEFVGAHLVKSLAFLSELWVRFSLLKGRSFLVFFGLSIVILGGRGCLTGCLTLDFLELLLLSLNKFA
jgi:hypothetical protein